METLESNAVARLVMVSGSLVSDAEISDVLGSYGYVEDGLTPNRYDHQVEDGCGIELSPTFETIEIFGESKDHLNNINYMLQRFGWIDCELYSQSRDVEHMLLGRLVNINITKNVVEDGAFPLAGGLELVDLGKESFADEVAVTSMAAPASFPVLESEPPRDTDPENEALQMLEGDFHRIQELTLELGRTREELDIMSEQYNRAMARIQELQRKGSSASVPASDISHTSNSGLFSFVEKYLISMIDLESKLGSTVVEDLRQSGYQIQLKLVPVV